MSENDLTEIWRPVIGFDKYSVSSLGRVRRNAVSNGTKGGLILKCTCHRGYYIISLHIKGRKSPQTMRVHRLVLEAFLGPRPPGYQCNHKDGNKANNTVGNLEWVTPAENTKHAIAVLGHYPGHMGENNPSAILTVEKVMQIRRRYSLGQSTQTELARIYDIGVNTLHCVVRRKTWKHI